MSNEMPKDIAAELRVRAAIEQVKGSLFERAADEIERLRQLSGKAGQLRKERDEARWRLCKVVGDNRGVWGCEIAKENGWDYLATEHKP